MRSLLFIFFLVSSQLHAQEVEIKISENLIPNPSFEKFSSTPVGWFYKGVHFTKIMKSWDAPTLASPDVFGPDIRVPKYWSDKGFGNIIAKEGKHLVGITTFGCEEGKPHCKEYIQSLLNEPLVVGQKYRISFWVKNLKNSLQSNNIGIAFTNGRHFQNDDAPVPLEAIFNHEQVMKYNDRWLKIEGTFKAKEVATHIIIGNFFNDEETKTQAPSNLKLNYSYYYIDDVMLVKKLPILEVPKDQITWNDKVVTTGDLISLKNIFFAHDKAELLSSSFTELDLLLNLMNKYPGMEIEIYGHTDANGNDDYNIDLSLQRAAAVKHYLLQKGISPNRLNAQGFGENSPIASNRTDAGRQLNRRVEFKILDM